MNRLLAIGLLLAASCGDDDGSSDDLPDDLVVDSDRIFLDSDDVRDDADDGSDDVLDDVMDGGDVIMDASAGAIVLSESFVDFGVIQVGGTPGERTVDVFNTGPTDVFIGLVDVVGPGFSLTGSTCVMVLLSGASCSLVVTAAPAMVGEQTGELLVRTDVQTVSAFLHMVGIQ